MTIRKGKLFIPVALILAFLGGSLVSTTDLWPEADAAPTDIIGSPNVAVSSFRTEQGSFVLFSDGTIKDAESGADLGREYEDPEPNTITPSTPSKGRVLGAPQVAVDVVEVGEHTYVVFADGSIKKHKSLEASAASPLPRIERGFWNGFELFDATPGSTVTGGGGTYTVHFKPPFKKRPAVLFTPVEGAAVGYADFRRNPNPPISSVDVNFRNTDGNLNPSAFTFTVTGN